MDIPRGIGRLFSRLGESAKEIAAKFHRQERVEPPPAMIGLPPSGRGLTGRPADPALHAQQVAREWEEVAEAHVQKTMRELGIPDYRIGAPDYERGGILRAFLSEETRGGTNDLACRLYVDSGMLNPQLNAEAIGPEASKIWAKSRLRDRIKAVIAHEDLESTGIPPDEVVQRARDTVLPIGENARKILRSMAEGVKRER
jgi:hypothetical protein